MQELLARATHHVLLGPLFLYASHKPERELCTFLDERGATVVRHTFGSMARRTLELAALMQQDWGLKRGDRVLLLYPPSMDFFEAYAACLLLGVVPCPVYPPDPLRPDARLGALGELVTRAGARALLTTRAYRRAVQLGRARALLTLRAPRWPELPWLLTDGSARKDHTASLVLPELKEHELALLQFTSGSTSTPKGVRLTFGNLLHQLAFNRDRLGLDTTCRAVIWVPQYHDLGLISFMTSAMVGNGALWFMSPTTFLHEPALWCEVMHRVRCTHTASPNFGYALVTRKTSAAQRQGWDLSSVRVLMSAAEPIVAETMDAFFEAFAPSGLTPACFVPAYGLAEHTVGVTLGEGLHRLQLDRATLAEQGVVRADTQGDLTLVSCGRPSHDIALCLVDASDPPRRLGENEVGEIWINSSSLADGYEGASPEENAPFKGRLEGDPRAWFRTGDMGFMHRGELYVTGRSKDVIIVRGRNYHPEDIEEQVRRSDPAIRPGGVVAFGVSRDETEALVVLAEVQQPEGVDVARLRATLRGLLARTLGLRAEVALLAPRTLPKTTSGKIRRQEARRAWIAGELAPLHAAGARTSAERDAALKLDLEEQLATIDLEERVDWLAHTLLTFARAQEHLDLPPTLTLDTPLIEAGLDSVMVAELAGLLSDYSAVSLSPSTLLHHPTLRALASHVLDQLGLLHLDTLTPPEAPEEERITPRRVLSRALSPAQSRVMIVGGGIEAWVAALTLARHGYSAVTMLDTAQRTRDSRWSVATGRRDGRGAWLIPSSWRTIIELVDTLDLPIEPVEMSHDLEVFYADFGLEPGPARGPMLTWAQRVLRAVKGEPLAPDERFDALLRRHKLSSPPLAMRACWQALVSGPLDAAPASHVVELLELLVLEERTLRVEEIEPIETRCAHHLSARWGVTLRHDLCVTALSVNEDHVQLTTSEGVFEAEEVIFTGSAPELEGSLDRLQAPDAWPVLEPTWHEHALCLLIASPGMSELHIEPPPQPEACQLLHVARTASEDRFIVISRYDDTLTLDEAEALVRAQLGRIWPGSERAEVLERERIEVAAPHIEPTTERAFLAQLEQAQGERRLWWLGGPLCGATIEQRARHARRVLESALTHPG